MSAGAPTAVPPGAALPAPAGLAEADAAAAEALLRCWVRETGVREPADGVLRIDLPAANARLEADVGYWSLAGWHRFGAVRHEDGSPADAVSVATLLVTEAASGRPAGAAHRAELAARVADSVRRVAGYLTERRARPESPPGSTPFLEAERALLLGHPMHPTPKSRGDLTGAEARAYSPELRGSFALHWFAADPRVVSGEVASPPSADNGADNGAVDIAAALAGEVPGCPPGMVLVPAHPWQAQEVRSRPRVRRLLEDGLLVDLGQAGPAWFPTSSVRTVYRPDAPYMLKLSLGLDITNSKRENKRAELRRGAEIHRLLEAGLGAALADAHPGFGIVRDPAWLAVDPAPAGDPAETSEPAETGEPAGTGEPPEGGLEVAIRENPFGPRDRVACVAGLVAERPDLGRSGLAARVEDLAAQTDRTVAEIAEEWFARYLTAVVEPVLWLYGEYGLGLEAHQQNTLVALDMEGWPAGGWYRDNQGYYLSATRVGELERFLPGVGVDGDSRCDDTIIDERLGYYIGINNVLGLIGAFGSQRLAAERRLLGQFRAFLRRMHRLHGEKLRLAATLADSATLRCKFNLLTRVDGLDELVGPLASQSVYGDIANPIACENPEVSR